jgi:hypothetical protein
MAEVDTNDVNSKAGPSSTEGKSFEEFAKDLAVFFTDFAGAIDLLASALENVRAKFEKYNLQADEYSRTKQPYDPSCHACHHSRFLAGELCRLHAPYDPESRSPRKRG